MSEKRFFLSLHALVAGAILLCSAALLFLLTLSEGGLPRIKVASPPPQPAPANQLSDPEPAAESADRANPAAEPRPLEQEQAAAASIADQSTLAGPDKVEWWRSELSAELARTAEAAPIQPEDDIDGAHAEALGEKGSDIAPWDGEVAEGGSDDELLDDDFPTGAIPADAAEEPAQSADAADPNRTSPAPDVREPLQRQQATIREQRTAPQEPRSYPQAGSLAALFSGTFASQPSTLGPSGKISSPQTSQVRRVSAGTYGASVRAMVARHKPRVGASGSATVTFGIGPAGALRYVRVSRSSGNAKLDQMAISAVRSAAPFPPPPAGSPSYSVRIYFQ